MSFTIRSVFLAFLVVAASFGAFGPSWGLFMGAMIVGAVVVFRLAAASPAEPLVVLAIVLILIVLLAPFRSSSGRTSRCVVCRNNLTMIGLALRNYHDEFGSFPPAYVPGPDGKPWHSWRVLILPYLEEPNLYAAYRFDEPWNGPANSKLAGLMPSIFRCPETDDRNRAISTPYLAVVGTQTAWPGPKPRRLAEITDEHGGTILLMETAGLGVSWMEPRDLDYDQIAGMRKPDPKVVGVLPHPHERGLLSVVQGGEFHVVMADDTVANLRWGVSGEELARMLTVAGGDEVRLDDVIEVVERQTDWPRIFSLLLLGVSVPLLWRSISRRPKKA